MRKALAHERQQAGRTAERRRHARHERERGTVGPKPVMRFDFPESMRVRSVAHQHVAPIRSVVARDVPHLLACPARLTQKGSIAQKVNRASRARCVQRELERPTDARVAMCDAREERARPAILHRALVDRKGDHLATRGVEAEAPQLRRERCGRSGNQMYRHAVQFRSGYELRRATPRISHKE